MICTFGEFEMDAALFELRRGGQRVALEPKVFDLLSYLVLHRERVVPRDEIFAALWPNEFVSDAALGYAIRAARKAIGDDGHHQRLIRTVHRRGFRFVGKVLHSGETVQPLPEVGAAQPPSGFPFVGRDRELAQLRAALDDAVAGRGSLHLVSGEPGIGKTRLVRELAAVASRRGFRVLIGRCFEGAGTPAFSPWIEALGSFVRSEGEEDLQSALGDNAADVAALIPEIRERFAHLPALPTMDPERARFRLLDGVARFLARAASRTPILLVLDDLHWADFSSLLLLQFIAREIPPLRLLVVATHRDLGLARDHPFVQTLGDLARVEACRRLVLGGLDLANVASFVRGASCGEPPESVIASIHRDTDGNPFFVTELVRLLVASAPSDAPMGGRLAIPPTVRHAVAARLGSVSASCASTLEAASAIGREFDVPLLASVLQAQHPSADIRGMVLQAIDEAVAVRMIEAVGSPTSVARLRRYRFVHSLVREVVYDGLGGSRQAHLHGIVGDALERMAGSELGRLSGELAHHFAHAGEEYGAKAVRYAVAAAKQAAALMAYEEASAHYELALRLLESTGDDRRRCELLLALGWSRWQANDAARARAAVGAAARLARSLASADMFAEAALSYGDSFRGFEMGVHEPELVELLEDALAGLGELDGGLRARALARLAVALYHVDGSEERRHALSRQAVAMSRRSKDPAAELAALYSRHWAIWGPDSLDSRLQAATRMVRLSERLGDGEMSFHAHRFRFMDLLEQGEMAPLEREFQLCEQLAGQLRQPYYWWYIDTFRALRAFLDGRFEDCERLANQAADVGRLAQNRNVLQILGVQIFALRREQGRLAEIREAVLGFINTYPNLPAWRAALAVACAEIGARDLARAELDRFAADGFATLPRDTFWLGAMAGLADVCAILGDSERAPVLYRLLKPLASVNVTLAPGAVCNGSVARVLGRLSATMGRWDRASRHFEEALQTNRRLGAPHFIAHTQAQYADMLLARGQAGDRARATGLREESAATYRRLGLPTAEHRARVAAPARRAATR